MMQCPVCKSRQVGKIGTDHYYCWSCFIEFSTKDGGEVFEIEEDGNLVALEVGDNYF